MLSSPWIGFKISLAVRQFTSTLKAPCVIVFFYFRPKRWATVRLQEQRTEVVVHGYVKPWCMELRGWHKMSFFACVAHKCTCFDKTIAEASFAWKRNQQSARGPYRGRSLRRGVMSQTCASSARQCGLQRTCETRLDVWERDARSGAWGFMVYIFAFLAEHTLLSWVCDTKD